MGAIAGGVLDTTKAAEKAAKKAEKMQSGGNNAPMFYIFKLVLRNKLGGDEWVFMPY